MKVTKSRAARTAVLILLLIVSMIVGTLHTVSGYTEEPAEILGELNRRLCGRMHEGFATCLAVRIEENGRLTLANAGHLAP